jgi:hypothetical protein
MKKAFIIPALFCFAAFTFAFPADARPGGCIKGAIVGGIAGHFLGHGGMGAAAGCAYGVHGGSPTIAKMGTRAALATNSVVERSGNSGN